MATATTTATPVRCNETTATTIRCPSSPRVFKPRPVRYVPSVDDQSQGVGTGRERVSSLLHTLEKGFTSAPVDPGSASPPQRLSGESVQGQEPVRLPSREYSRPYGYNGPFYPMGYTNGEQYPNAFNLYSSRNYNEGVAQPFMYGQSEDDGLIRAQLESNLAELREAEAFGELQASLRLHGIEIANQHPSSSIALSTCPTRDCQKCKAIIERQERELLYQQGLQYSRYLAQSENLPTFAPAYVPAYDVQDWQAFVAQSARRSPETLYSQQFQYAFDPALLSSQRGPPIIQASACNVPDCTICQGNIERHEHFFVPQPLPQYPQPGPSLHPKSEEKKKKPKPQVSRFRDLFAQRYPKAHTAQDSYPERPTDPQPGSASAAQPHATEAIREPSASPTRPCGVPNCDCHKIVEDDDASTLELEANMVLLSINLLALTDSALT